MDREYRKYDPADFVIPANDAKGHSERFQCRLSPADDRALDVILSSKKFPFRSKGDIGRWAIHVAIRKLEAMEEVPSVTAQVDAMVTILRDEMFSHEFMQTFEAMNRVITTHLGAGATGEARRVVSLIRHQISKMPDGYWKDRYNTELDRRFGNLLEAAPVRNIGKHARKAASAASSD